MSILRRLWPSRKARRGGGGNGSRLTLWPESLGKLPQRWLSQGLSSYAQEGFSANSLIYSAIMYKVRSQQAAPLRAYRGDEDHPEQLDRAHPLSQLISRPNAGHTWSEFQGIQTVFLNLSGNAYAYVDRSSGGPFPTQIVPLRPDWVYHVPGDRGGLLGYIYAPNGDESLNPDVFLPEEILHVKFPHPMDPLGGAGPGLSPIAPMASSGDVDNMVSRFLKEFFTHGAMPLGVLRFQTALDERDMEAVRERWRDKYGGAANWLDVAVLSDGGEYQRIGLTFSEMGFHEIDARNETRILSTLGVPPILLGTRTGMEHSAMRNVEEARRIFWEDTFIPELMLYEEAYRHAFSSGDVWVSFDTSRVPALQEDIPQLVESAHILWSMGYPANVATRAVGLILPEFPAGEVSFLPSTVAPVQADGAPQVSPDAPAPPPPPVPPDEDKGDPLDPQVRVDLLDLLVKSLGKAGESDANRRPFPR